MTLEDYTTHIQPHLIMIEAGASMAARHASAMVAKPCFETMAEADLAAARKTLGDALEKIVQAQAAYQSKKLETSL